MAKRAGYGQYCPLSMAAELLCSRWTFLVLRELLEGSTSFNEIARGVPLMSRTLLSQRLKELEKAGLLTRHSKGRGRAVAYRLTSAGQAFGPIIRQMAEWGQEWIDTEPSLEDIDTDFLIWDIRRNVAYLPEFPVRFVVHFHFPDAPEKKTDHWLLFENGEVDVCYLDPGYDIDIEIEASVKDMTRVWMGWLPLKRAVAEDRIVIDGPRQFTADVTRWLNLSSLAHIQKQPRGVRVLETV